MTSSKRGTCSECGKAVYRGPTSAIVQRCRDCQRARPKPKRQAGPHSLVEWLCAGCGASCRRRPTKGQRPKWCKACRSLGRDWIAASIRRSVYERDGWVCQICREAVDADLIGSRSPWRPSLDHIVPRSLGGSDEPENLRLAHLWCNAALSDGRSYTDDDFRIAV